MRFPTLTELDTRRYRRLATKGWHRWFSWRPVVIDDHWHWLRPVERRYIESWIEGDFQRFYREIPTQEVGREQAKTKGRGR